MVSIFSSKSMVFDEKQFWQISLNLSLYYFCIRLSKSFRFDLILINKPNKHKNKSLKVNRKRMYNSSQQSDYDKTPALDVWITGDILLYYKEITMKCKETDHLIQR